MNTRTSDPRDIADASMRHTASRARRVKRTVDHGPPRSPRSLPSEGVRPATTVRLVIAAALVSAASLVVVTTTRHDDAARGTTALAATPRADHAPGRDAIDHGAIAPDAPSAGDAETVEASIAAYER